MVELFQDREIAIANVKFVGPVDEVVKLIVWLVDIDRKEVVSKPFVLLVCEDIEELVARVNGLNIRYLFAFIQIYFNLVFNIYVKAVLL